MYRYAARQQMRSYLGMKVGAERRVRAMFYRGFGTNRISQLTGLDQKVVDGIANGSWDVSEREFNAVRSGFTTTLCLDAPKDSPAKQAQAVASKNGWQPFGVWSDIDDPDCQPERVLDPETEAAMLKIRKLVAMGWNIKHIAKTSGINPSNAYEIVYGRSGRCLRRVTLDKIETGYQKLKDGQPPEGIYADKSRQLAKDNGWTTKS